MKEKKYISEINNQYLKKYQEEFNYHLLLAIENLHDEFEPYRSNPKHYILSIYDPLELYLVLLGKRNFAIKLNFTEREEINKNLIKHFELDENDIDSIYDEKVISLKRKIEYEFLRRCLTQIELKTKTKIQLYTTQHLTEVSYDISNMKSIDADYLWENLEN